MEQSISDLKAFLEDIPPGGPRRLAKVVQHDGVPRRHVVLPVLDLHCDTCDGKQKFAPRYAKWDVSTHGQCGFLRYACRNCEEFEKLFAVYAIADENYEDLHIAKIGELPAFGDPLPSRLQRILGGEWPQMVSGRRAESQG